MNTIPASGVHVTHLNLFLQLHLVAAQSCIHNILDCCSVTSKLLFICLWMFVIHFMLIFLEEFKKGGNIINIRLQI